VDAGLFEAVDDVDRSGGRRGVGRGGEGGGEGAIAIAEGEALEEGAPRGVDGIRLIKQA